MKTYLIGIGVILIACFSFCFVILNDSITEQDMYLDMVARNAAQAASLSLDETAFSDGYLAFDKDLANDAALKVVMDAFDLDSAFLSNSGKYRGNFTVAISYYDCDEDDASYTQEKATYLFTSSTSSSPVITHQAYQGTNVAVGFSSSDLPAQVEDSVKSRFGNWNHGTMTINRPTVIVGIKTGEIIALDSFFKRSYKSLFGTDTTDGASLKSIQAYEIKSYGFTI